MRATLPKPSGLALIAVLFLAVSFGVYGASFGNGFVSLDDPGLITANPIVASMNATTVKKAFTSYDPELYIPLTLVSYQIDHLIGGFDPFIYHFTNLLLHTMNALLVSWLLFLLLENGWLAVGLGLIFAIHPLNTEAALWASARKDVLSTLFFLSSLLAYVYATEHENRKLFVASVLLFACGLLSKVMVVTLPLVLLLIDDVRGRRIDGKTLTEKIPYALIAIVFGIIGIFGKTENLVSSTFWQKIMMACKSTVFYLEKFFVPSGLSVTYPYTNEITVASPDFFVPLLFVILFMCTALWLRKRNQLVAFGMIFFIVTLLPTFLNFSKGGDVYFASDRYAYIPMIGLLISVAATAKRWYEGASSVHSISSRRMMLTGAATCIVASCGVLSLKQSEVWQSSRTLYDHVLLLYPDSRLAHNNLGMEQLLSGEIDDAIASFNRALEIHPDPKTRVNLAAAEVRKGNVEDAETIYRDVARTNPEIPDSFYGLGEIDQKRGKLVEAASWYRNAIAADPSYGNAYNNLGGVYLQLHDWKNAEEVLRKSIKLRPDFVESSYNLAIALKELGQNDESEALLRSVISVNPSDGDALANLAELLYNRKAIDEAATMLKQALAIDQNNPVGYALLLRMKKDGIVR